MSFSVCTAEEHGTCRQGRSVTQRLVPPANMCNHQTFINLWNSIVDFFKEAVSYADFVDEVNSVLDEASYEFAVSHFSYFVELGLRVVLVDTDGVVMYGGKVEASIDAQSKDCTAPSKTTTVMQSTKRSLARFLDRTS